MSPVHQPWDPEGGLELYLVKKEPGLLSNQTFLGKARLCGGALHVKVPGVDSGDPQAF